VRHLFYDTLDLVVVEHNAKYVVQTILELRGGQISLRAVIVVRVEVSLHERTKRMFVVHEARCCFRGSRARVHMLVYQFYQLPRRAAVFVWSRAAGLRERAFFIYCAKCMSQCRLPQRHATGSCIIMNKVASFFRV
jgi:hypothetical protein